MLLGFDTFQFPVFPKNLNELIVATSAASILLQSCTVDLVEFLPRHIPTKSKIILPKLHIKSSKILSIQIRQNYFYLIFY